MQVSRCVTAQPALGVGRPGPAAQRDDAELSPLLPHTWKKKKKDSAAMSMNGEPGWGLSVLECDARAELQVPHQRWRAIVELNVGGGPYTTTVFTLTQVPDSMLAALCSQDAGAVTRDSKRRMFIDRNGTLFAHVLDFLRDPLYWRPPRQELERPLRREFEFFGLPFPQGDPLPIGSVPVQRNYYAIHEPSVVFGAEKKLYRPWGIAVDRSTGNIIVSQYEGGRVLMYSSDGTFLREFGAPLLEPLPTLQCGVAVDRAGNVLVVDWRHHRILVFSPEGRWIRTMYSARNLQTAYAAPCGVAVDQAGYIIITEFKGNRVLVLAPDCTLVHSFGSSGSEPGQFNNPCGVAVGLEGDIIVADEGNHRVQMFKRDGTFLRVIESDFISPRGVAVDSVGRILVTDTNNHKVKVFQPDGTFLCTFGSFGDDTDMHFNRPSGIAVDAQGRIIVADQYNERVQIF